MRTSTRSAVLLLLAAGCGGPPGLQIADDGGVIRPIDAAITGDASSASADAARDAAPPLPDAGPPTGTPLLVFDDIHIAGLSEEPSAFAMLGMALNSQYASAIADGTMLDGVALEGLDDASGADDAEVTAVFHKLADSDADAGDNFDPDAPESFTVNDGLVPAATMSGAIVAGRLSASAAGDTAMALLPTTTVPLPIYGPTIEGQLHAGGDPVFVRTLDQGRLRGAVRVQALYLIPNPASGTCVGSTLLDVMVSGCGIGPFGQQPDEDLNGDGLEGFFDDSGDGSVDRCVRPDGSETTGTWCPLLSSDGYSIAFVLGGVRGLLP